MEFGRADIAVDRDPIAGRSIWAYEADNAAIIRLQQVAVGIKGHEAGIGVRRGRIGAGADNVLPGGSTPAEPIAVKSVAANSIGERTILPVAADKHHVWI